MSEKPIGLLVCGDRNWTDRDLLYMRLTEQQPVAFVLQGMCRGADLMARDWALANNLRCYGHPADWKQHGKAAGPIRNAEMLERLVMAAEESDHPIRVVAFHADIEHSKGTKDMINQAKRANVECVIYP